MGTHCKNARKCHHCLEVAKSFFETQFTSIHCCHSCDMILTTATQDKIDRNLWQTYHDLSSIRLPIKDYKDDKSIVYEELTKRLHEVQDIWYSSRKKEAWGSRMIEFLARLKDIEHYKTMLDRVVPPFFKPTEEQLMIIRNELPYFGIMNDDMDFFYSKVFLFEMILEISPIYATLDEFSSKYAKLLHLEKSGRYPKSMDKPKFFIERIVFDAIIKDIILFFQNNI